MELWWCLDCRSRVELNRHGRCQICGSEAVDSMERTGMYKTASSVLTPVGDVIAERVTVRMETTLHLEEEDAAPLTAEPAYSY
jgi:hypothetical protein